MMNIEHSASQQLPVDFDDKFQCIHGLIFFFSFG